ncbi:MAG: MATE family efflux transporter [Oscillospiraceae bacterium]|nr:MATE family efflux transporter [Oscillospiraceae bacterium]
MSNAQQSGTGQEVRAENKMGTMPMGKLLFSMALPMMISMMVQALYNVVDSIFVSRVSEDALTALSLAFPVQNLMIAVGSGTGVGINALLSRSLGEKKFEQANRTACNGLFLAIVSAAAFLLFGLFGTNLYFTLQTDIPAIIEGGDAYLGIVCIGSVFLFGQVTLERLLQSTGKTMYSMISQSTGAIVNIILDPIMIFGLLGFPAMGVAGAAVATVIGQALACLIGLYLNLTRNKEITFRLQELRPRGGIVGQIYKVGVPSIVMMSIGSLMTLGMNTILMGFSSTATAIFGVYFKLQSFAVMPVIGMNNAMVPIIAYNYGARHKERIVHVIKLSICVAEIMLTLFMIIFQIFPDKFLALFDASEHMLSMGIPALRIITTHFVLAGFCIIAGSVFQALGNGMLSLIVSVARQLVVLLPAAWLLSLSGDVNMVWWAFPIAELASLLFSALFLRHIYKKEILPLDKPAA